MSNESPEQIAADYWNLHLEHNRLRISSDGKGADTNAGAFLAWMLEGAGDILRESSKGKYADRGYMFEKLNRLKNNINSRDWRDRISEREDNDRRAILKQVEAIPDSNNAFIKQVKALMVAILIRAPANVDYAREKLIPLLPAGYNYRENESSTSKPSDWQVINGKWVKT